MVLMHDGKTVYEDAVEFPDADKVREQRIDVRGDVVTDHIELYFSDPVLKTLAGEAVPEGAVNPGYREIRTRWDGRRDAK
jgi:hypothetical protein